MDATWRPFSHVSFEERGREEKDRGGETKKMSAIVPTTKKRRRNRPVVVFPDVETVEDVMGINIQQIRLISSEDYAEIVDRLGGQSAMTEEQAKVVRYHRRLIKNRESAQRSRKRKENESKVMNAEMDALRERVREMDEDPPCPDAEHPDIVARIWLLEQKTRQLTTENERLRESRDEFASLACIVEMEHLQNTVEDNLWENTRKHDQLVGAIYSEVNRMNLERGLLQEKVARLERTVGEQARVIRRLDIDESWTFHVSDAPVAVLKFPPPMLTMYDFNPDIPRHPPIRCFDKVAAVCGAS